MGGLCGLMKARQGVSQITKEERRLPNLERVSCLMEEVREGRYGRLDEGRFQVTQGERRLPVTERMNR